MNSRDIIRSLMTNTKSVIYFKDAEGRFIMVNQKWLEHYPMEMQKIIGQHSYGSYTEEIAERDRAEELWVETLNEVRVTEEQVVEADGLHYFLVTRFPVHDGEERVIGTGCISTEITDRRRLQQDLQKSQDQLHEQLVYDRLTAAFSRDTFYQRAELEVVRHRRYHHPVVILAIEVDRFKALSDRYGHQLADDTLVALVERIQDVLRDTDAICRLGDVEFAVIAPETEVDGGEKLARRILNAIRQEPFPVVQLVTVSVGVARAIEGDDLDQLLGRAESALTQAREEGGNRAVVEDL